MEFLYIFCTSRLVVVVGWCVDSLEEASHSYLLFTVAGLLVYFAFILGMWFSLERPPLRTMGETRLWYAFFLPTAGLIIYSRWRYPWILAFSTLLAGVFTTINLVNPEIHNKTLMPALQSPWFAPHVIVYMFAYAMLGAAALMAAYLLWFKKSEITEHELDICDNLVHVGWAFMTVGILFGALWAKEAWGHYWAWDPKENLGSCHLVCLFGVYPCAFARRSLSSCGTLGIDCFFCAVADVLVGHQLFAFCTRSKRAYL